MTDERKYLKELGERLDDSVKQIKLLEEAGGDEKLVNVLKEMLEQEKGLRESHEIGARFKVIQTQLQSLLKEFEKEVNLAQEEKEVVSVPVEKMAEDEMLVYVHLFNSQGAALKTWQNLLLPRALIEHSVNRPVYTDKKYVEGMLRFKPNKNQHAFLKIVIKKDDAISIEQETSLQDQYGFPLLRLKQGALKLEKAKKFLHNDRVYNVSAEGEITLAE
jgi:hypothetical protein